MKGAIAELLAKTISPPRPKSISNIGVIHHHLLRQKNMSKPPMIPNLLVSPSNRFIAVPQSPFWLANLSQGSLINHTIAEH
jgi:hypothetical protein